MPPGYWTDNSHENWVHTTTRLCACGTFHHANDFATSLLVFMTILI